MHVKDAEEDADALAGAFGGLDERRFSDFAVAGRDDEPGAGGDGARRVAEKPEEKAASRTGTMPHAQLPVAQRSTAATASRLRP